MTTISKEIMFNHGYHLYDSKEGDDYYQKKFCDKNGVKFFIDVVNFKFKFTPNISSCWEFSIQFETKKGSVEIKTVQWFNEDGMYSGNTVQDAEKYLENMWQMNGCPYYEEYK